MENIRRYCVNTVYSISLQLVAEIKLKLYIRKKKTICSSTSTSIFLEYVRKLMNIMRYREIMPRIHSKKNNF